MPRAQPYALSVRWQTLGWLILRVHTAKLFKTLLLWIETMVLSKGRSVIPEGPKVTSYELEKAMSAKTAKDPSFLLNPLRGLFLLFFLNETITWESANL